MSRFFGFTVLPLVLAGCNAGNVNNSVSSACVPGQVAETGDDDCDGVLTADDCNDNNAQSTTVATDGDCDGVLTADDCNDADANSTSLAQDTDCDAVETADDCDDMDAALGLQTFDLDCDGTLNLNDCAPNDPLTGATPNDADCDGILATADCDDLDPASTAVANDADCDGLLTAEDCDDSNPTSAAIAADADCDGLLTADDCDDNNPDSTAIAADTDCDGLLTADDCDDNNTASTAIATDADCDGLLTADDCDDNDPMVTTNVADDADCDGLLTAEDCNDNDPMVTTNVADDADCDGLLTADDCDDTSPSSTAIADDADCDGLLTADDCNDNDPISTAIAADADCDGLLTADDCDDGNTAATAIADDADCDGLLTADDCNDADPTVTTNIAADADCDGLLTADDCDDSNPASTAIADDADCDGLITANDCNDNEPTVTTTVSTDGDCDGLLTADDCDDSNPTSTAIAEDGDCDGLLTAVDCNDADPTVTTTVAEDADCDGHFTADDCDDNDPTSTTIAADADCDGVITVDDCNDNDPTSTTVLQDPNCDGVPDVVLSVRAANKMMGRVFLDATYPPFTFEIVDQFDVLIDDSSTVLTLAQDASSDGTLGGTLAATALNGVVTFDAVTALSPGFVLIDVNASGGAGVMKVQAMTTQVSGPRVQLSTQRWISIQNATRAVAADFNGDGYADIFAAARPMTVFLGDGEGFGPGQVLSTFGSPQDGKGFDIDDDGDMDIVIAYTSRSRVEILRNNGHGTFTHTNLTDQTFVNRVALGDINGDGRVDVVSARSGRPGMRIFLQDVDGNFGVGNAPNYVVTTTDVDDMAVGHLDDDGFADALYSTDGLNVFILWGQADGNLAGQTTVDPLPTGQIDNLTIADVVGDGRADIVANHGSFFSASLVSVENLGNRSFGSAISSVGANGTITAVEVTGDANTDLFLAGKLYAGDGLGGFTSVGDSGRGAHLAVDMNGDGILDAVGATLDAITIATGDGAGAFDAPPLLPQAAFQYDLEVGQVNSNVDSRDDLILNLRDLDTFGITLGDGVGSFGSTTQIPTAQAWGEIDVADVNGDNVLDLLGGDSTGVMVHLGDGDGGFAPGVLAVTGARVAAIDVGYFDADAHIDLVVGHVDTAVAGWAPGNGDGTFGTFIPLAIGTPSGAPTAAIGDVDGDGSPDIVVGTSVPNEIQIHFGDGAGGVSQVVTEPGIAGPRITVLADLDSINGLDILEGGGTSFSSQLAVLVNQGSRTFAGSSRDLPGDWVRDLELVDVTGDAILDLAIAPINEAGITVYPGDGAGDFYPPETFAYYSTNVVSGDFDGDGLPDLACVAGKNIGVMLSDP